MANLTYRALLQATQVKETTLAHYAESAARAANAISELAENTASDAKALEAKSVDPDTRAECQELAKAIRGLSNGAGIYASRAIDTAKAAKAAGDQARATHGGFQEARNRSPVTDLDNVSRDWLEQE